MKVKKDILKFPDGFLWGTAIAAHQNEGENTNSDWWNWEQSHINFPKSGKACDHYGQFESDFELAKNILHNNTIRISIEWAKIEPEEGKWDEDAILHYKKVFESLKKLKLKPFVTLFHFTMPLWFAQKGGFKKSSNTSYFIRYVSYIAEVFKDDIEFWIVVNEPSTYIGSAYF